MPEGVWVSDQEFKIKKSKIRGVESLGMICAEDEIGVGKSHDGIIVITDDVKPGTPAAQYYRRLKASSTLSSIGLLASR